MLSINVGQTPEGKYQANVGVSWWMPIFCTAGIARPNHFCSNRRIPIDNESLMFYRLRWSCDPISDEDFHALYGVFASTRPTAMSMVSIMAA